MTRRARPLVLHVDDQEAVRRVVARTLTRDGLQVIEAATGAAGLAAASEQRPDVAVLDVNLPDICGLEVCQRLRADRKTSSIPILFLSGERPEPGDRVAGLRGGADAYLVQPAEPAELVAMVRALLRIRRSEEHARRLLRRAQSRADAREEALSVALADARAPLSSLQIAAQGLIAALPAEDPVARSRALAMLEASSAALRALTDLHDLARLESGRLRLALADEPAAEVLRAAASCALALPASQLAIEDGLPPGTVLRCDRGRVAQAVQQLARSALASHAARMRLAARAEEGAVRFSFGAEAGRHLRRDGERAFQQFWERRSARRPVSIGLAAARAIVDAHGGRIWAEEERGPETVFHFTLPLRGPEGGR